MNKAEIIAHQKRRREFNDTELGAAFLRFERAHSNAWALDGQENASYRRLKNAFNESDAARETLVKMLRPLAGLDP